MSTRDLACVVIALVALGCARATVVATPNLGRPATPDQIAGWSRPGDPPWRRAADYVSGMTDGFALRRAQALGLDI